MSATHTGPHQVTTNAAPPSRLFGLRVGPWGPAGPSEDLSKARHPTSLQDQHGRISQFTACVGTCRAPRPSRVEGAGARASTKIPRPLRGLYACASLPPIIAPWAPQTDNSTPPASGWHPPRPPLNSPGGDWPSLGSLQSSTTPPEASQEAPKTVQEDPDSPKDGSKTPKMASRQPKMPSSRPKKPPEATRDRAIDAKEKNKGSADVA